MEMVHTKSLRDDLALAIAKLERVQRILNEEDRMSAPSLMAANSFIKQAAVLMFDVSLPLESAMERITPGDMEEYAATLKPTEGNEEEDDIEEQPEGQRYIVTLHYLKLLSGKPDLYNAIKQTAPPIDLEESHGGDDAFPKHCHYCGRDELRFSRVEEHKPDDEGNVEITKVYEIHHVVCPYCGTEGSLEDFQ